MGQNIYVSDNGDVSVDNGGEGCGYLILIIIAILLVAPPFFIPLYFAFVICKWIWFLPDVHMMFRILAVGAAWAAEVAVLVLFWRGLKTYIPGKLLSLLCAVFVGVSYGAEGRLIGLDHVWNGGVVFLATGAICWWVYNSVSAATPNTFPSGTPEYEKAKRIAGVKKILIILSACICGVLLNSFTSDDGCQSVVSAFAQFANLDKLMDSKNCYLPM